jgi:hypothetical protein
MVETWLEFEAADIPNMSTFTKETKRYFPHGVKPISLIKITKKGSTEPGEHRSFKLRFNKPIQISSGQGTSAEEGGVVSWTMIPGGRTINVTLKRTGEKNRFPKPEDAIRIIASEGEQIWDSEHAPQLLSVTLLET